MKHPIKFIFPAVCAAFVLMLSAPDTFARKTKKKDKTEAAAPAPKPESEYDKLFKGKKCETVSGMMTLHNVEGKLYVELPLSLLGRDMLMGSTVSRITDNRFATAGEKPHEPFQFTFEKEGKKINVCRSRFDLLTEDESIRQSIRANSMESVLAAFDIKAYSPDSTAVVFDMTDFFLDGREELGPFPTLSPIGSIQLNKDFKRDLSHLVAVKAFSDNVSIRSSLSYNVTMSNRVRRVVYMNNQPFTAEMTRSIILLPEKPMRPRIADPRIGIFYQAKSKFGNGGSWVKASYNTRRWRLEPSDSAAWLRGELVEPVKPIVFYVDDAFPESWRPYIRNGVEVWQKAFERIGFKNAIVAEDYPEDDPEFDPDNIRYNCIRYSPSWTANAMGPSWADPRTGEILNASVYVYHNLVKLVQTWRFVQTAPADPDVRKVNIDEKILGDCISYVLSHEVGHCLSLMHNMAGSSGIPVDSLRSPSFTSRYGTTYSIMDYARNNFVAQPGDKERGVRLTPPELGEYDYYAIDWLYRPIPEAATPEDEVPVLNRWISEKSGDPVYRYGKQQFMARVDPSAFEEDLGDDPVEAARYGVMNLQYVMEHLNEWTAEDDPDFEFRQTIYNEIIQQYQRYLTRVLYNVGGIYLNERYEGDARESYAPVSREDQQRTVAFVMQQVKNLDWLDSQDVKRNFPLAPQIAPTFRQALFKSLLQRCGMLWFCTPIMGKDAYSQEDFLNEIFNAVWEPTRRGRSLTPVERDIQQIFISYLLTNSSVMMAVEQPAPYKLTSCVVPLPESVLQKSREDFGILPESVLGIFTNREGGLDEMLSEEHAGFAPFTGIQGQPPVSRHICFGLLDKSLKMLKSRVATGSEETRRHYEMLIHKIEQELK